MRALLAALLIGLVFGVADVGEPLENAMKLARNKLRDHPASGQIVLVAIDDRSLAEFGAGAVERKPTRRAARPRPRRRARSIHVDARASDAGASADAARLEASLAAARGRVTAARALLDRPLSERSAIEPPARFARHARLVNTNLYEW